MNPEYQNMEEKGGISSQGRLSRRLPAESELQAHGGEWRPDVMGSDGEEVSSHSNYWYSQSQVNLPSSLALSAGFVIHAAALASLVLVPGCLQSEILLCYPPFGGS